MSPSLLPDAADLAPVQQAITEALDRVARLCDLELQCDIEPVATLCSHVELYRGKMLRPTMVMLSGMVCQPDHVSISPQHDTIAAVCELVHMATLVHDDILDEAKTRRGGQTVNQLHGNEAAVILGDYLIAAAFHLCSTLDDPHISRLIGQVSMTMCAGELLQLHHRNDLSLTLDEYHQILNRKTAALIGISCRLGARCAGASQPIQGALDQFGKLLGVAFQIQDDLLDLTGDETVVGKTLGKDLEKGKLTLPLIHHLSCLDDSQRTQAETQIRSWFDTNPQDIQEQLIDRLSSTQSIEHARTQAALLVNKAKDCLADLPQNPAHRCMDHLADAVIARSY